VSYEDRTKAELQDELRDRELPVSGSKQELVDRLTEDDEDGQDQQDPDDETTDEDTIATDQSGSSSDGGSRKGPKPLQLARMAARQLEQISGRKIAGVTGVEQAEGGWRVGVDLVETARIPPATDVIGAYEVVVDADGDLVRYERIRRYIRGQAGDDQ
jgi:hypothetical protein